ncbi:hypothetical protein GCM10022280_01480 [Sphingomonas swuensis]|uniref:ABC transporter permease n=2 Tax=Sphingomonas swuensis TaxID=977800 RepID=A0ABP7S9C8_9SPHN
MHSPRTAWRDFKAVWARRSPDKTLAIGLSLGITLVIVVIFFLDASINTAPPTTVTYVESYGPDRTDAQIKADQVKDQKAREARARERQEQFQEIANTFGIE